MRMLSDEDLREKGIRFSLQHRHRLIKKGKFPKPVKLGIGQGTNAWVEDEIDAYLKARIEQRGASALFNTS
jgi:prophage regulatory protein